VYSILFLAATSFFLCLFLTPLVTQWSRRLELLDHPKTARKIHVVPVPRIGGIAIVVSCAGAIGLLLLSPLNGAASVDLSVALPLLPAAAAIFALGLGDDVVGLNAKEKLLGQSIAGYLAYLGGVHFTDVAGYTLPAWSSLPITIVWLVACANAFNLIDGMDGLAAGVGLFATLTTLVAALLNKNATLAIATAPLLGALLAFLRYNFNPASIFLGDCGSLTIGFLLGCFALIWSQKSATLLGMAAPLMALAVPLLDTGVTVARRFLRRQPVFSPDRNHLHHRLLDRGFSTRKVALILYGVCGVAAAFSLLQSMPTNRFSGLILIVFCVAAWVGIQSAGYIEFDTARHLVLTGTFRHLVSARLFVAEFEKKMCAAVTADDYWQTIREVGREFDCAHIRMALDGVVFEDRDRERERQPCCTMRIPLSENEYVNFKYPADSSVRHAVAISSVVDILQRALTARKPGLGPAVTHDTEFVRLRRARAATVTSSLEAAG
jgi:UDP-GlcNAc:undecaprenyl-phosphate GlcNAc-1-phosphate transferase